MNNYLAIVDGTYTVNFMNQILTVKVKDGVAISRESELDAELQILKNRYSELEGYLEATQEENEELEAKLAIAVEALEEIELDNHVHSDSYQIANKALEKLRGESV